MRNLKKTGKCILTVLAGLVVLVSLLTVFLRLTELDRKYSFLPFSLLQVQTGSMEPEMHAGDLLISLDSAYDTLQPGDDITYYRDGELITHRIVRFEGSRIVTKGLANNTEDRSVGPDEYCGRVVAVVPHLGALLTVLKNPVCLICAFLLLTLLFYSKELTVLLMDRTGNGKEKLRSGGVLKLLCLLMLAGFLCVTPMMTSAKYIAVLNGKAGMVADSLYMTSDCLTAEGKEFTVNGWNGDPYNLTVGVRNYNNEMLYNRAGTDLVYCLRVVKVRSDGGETYDTNYTLNVEDPDNALVPAENAEDFRFEPSLPSGDTYGPYIIPGSDSGGAADFLNLRMEADPGAEVHTGQKFRFCVYLVTDYGKGYYLKDSGDFVVNAVTKGSFIENIQISTVPGASLAEYRILTGTEGGTGTKHVKISWNNTRIYLNEYERTAYYVIRNYPGTRFFTRDDGSGHGYIVLPLQAYSSASLQFFKKPGYYQLGGQELEITAEIVNMAGEEETGNS